LFGKLPYAVKQQVDESDLDGGFGGGDQKFFPEGRTDQAAL
jgi:hypothetical protein